MILFPIVLSGPAAAYYIVHGERLNPGISGHSRSSIGQEMPRLRCFFIDHLTITGAAGSLPYQNSLGRGEQSGDGPESAAAAGALHTGLLITPRHCSAWIYSSLVPSATTGNRFIICGPVTHA